MMLRITLVTVTERPITGEHEISRNAVVQGMPECSANLW
jgi:hypothetical protein